MTVAMLIAPPGEPGTEYAAIGPARSRARALASARQPLPRHLDEGLVRQRWRGAGGALRVGAGRPGPAHQSGVEMRDELLRRHATPLRIEQRATELAGAQTLPGHPERSQMPVGGAREGGGQEREKAREDCEDRMCARAHAL